MNKNNARHAPSKNDQDLLSYKTRGTRDLLTAATLCEGVAARMIAVGSREMMQACPELTLTVAATERTLFNYICALLTLTKRASSGRKVMLGTRSGGLQAQRRRSSNRQQQQDGDDGNGDDDVDLEETHTLHGVAQQLEFQLSTLEQDPALYKAFARPTGGTCSLLYYLCCTLRATTECLEALEDTSTTSSAASSSLPPPPPPSSSPDSLSEEGLKEGLKMAIPKSSSLSVQTVVVGGLSAVVVGGGVAWWLSQQGASSSSSSSSSRASTGSSNGLLARLLAMPTSLLQGGGAPSPPSLPSMPTTTATLQGVASSSLSAAGSAAGKAGAGAVAAARAATDTFVSTTVDAAAAPNRPSSTKEGKSSSSSSSVPALTSALATAIVKAASEAVGQFKTQAKGAARARPVAAGAVAVVAVAAAVKTHTTSAEGLRKRKWRTKLRECDACLGVLLKLFTLVMYIVEAEKVRRSNSYHSLFLEPSAEDHDHKRKPTSRALVEAVPVPSAAAFWYDAEWSVFAFRRAMDSLYAACAKADLFFRFGGSLVGAPVAALWALYFALIDPTAASHHACFEMKNPSVRFIRRAWAPINSPLLVAGAQAISFVKGLRFQRHTTIAGVPCMVYAAHNPATAAGGDGDDSAGGNGGGGDGDSFGGNADEMSRDYVLYVHGGAFVASLHAADLGVISEWAVRFEKAVVVVPDYSLAPECPYPQALDELVRVYTALDGHKQQKSHVPFAPLGGDNNEDDDVPSWLPRVRRMAVAGESAGGNLSAALVLRLIALRDEQMGRGPPPWQQQQQQQQLQEGTMPLQKALPYNDEDGPSSSSSSSSKGGEGEEVGVSVSDGNRLVSMPCALVLGYPALNISLAPSPSRAVHHFDPVLGIGIMYAVLRMYPPPQLVSCPHEEPFLSPYHAPDCYLRRFPPTHLMAGGFDPLLDDAVDFDTRLRRLNVASTLHVESALPHGFLGLVHVSAHAHRALETATHFLEESFFGGDGKGGAAAAAGGGGGRGGGGEERGGKVGKGGFSELVQDLKCLFLK